MSTDPHERNVNIMKNIGMIVAVEIDAVLEKYGTRLEERFVDGFTVNVLQNDNYTLYICKTGAGEIAAAAGTQLLISKFGVDMVINFGVVGGLTPAMALAKTAVVERVAHYDFDISEIDHVEVGRYTAYPSVHIDCNKELLDKALELQPDLVKVTCASGDKFVGDPAKKQALHEQFDADICEMEAAGILLTCNRSGIPCLMIKTVSDSITGGAEEFTSEVNRSASICLDIADKIMANM